MLRNLLKDLKNLSDPQKSKVLRGFFKTGKGEYGEGDVFIGISALTLKKIAKKYKDLPHLDIEKLLASKVHEKRYLALSIIKINYEKEKDEDKKEELFKLSFKNISYINSWDLVDSFIPSVWGEYFFKRDRKILYDLALSSNFWERRISILTTFYFLKNGDFKDTIEISKMLIGDRHELVCKAVGRMLREVGKRDLNVLLDFLGKYSKIMPRKMLYYATEKLDKEKREFYRKRVKSV